MDLKARIPGGQIAVVKNVSLEKWNTIVEKMMAMEEDYINHKDQIDFRISADSVNLTALLLAILPPHQTTNENKVDSTSIIIYIPPFVYKKENGELVHSIPEELTPSVPIFVPQNEFPKELWAKSFKTRAELKERRIIAGGIRERISVYNIDPGLVPGDMITILDYYASKYRKKSSEAEIAEGIVHPLDEWKNAKSAKAKVGTNVFFLSEAIRQNQGSIKFFEKPSPDNFHTYQTDVIIRYVADVNERRSLTSETEGGSIITFPKQKDSAFAYEDKKKYVHQIFQPDLTVLQWKGNSENFQKIKINIRAWTSSIKSAKIRSMSNWLLLAPSILPVTDFIVMGNIDVTESGKYGINNMEDTPVSEGNDQESFALDDSWAFGLCVRADLIIFDMPKFLKEYGIPISENFVVEYFAKEKNKSSELFNDNDTMITLLNEYSPAIPTFLESQKNKLVFRAIPGGIQFNQGWKNEIASMTIEEGDGIASKKKSKGACSLGVQNKIFVFAINKVNFESYLSGKVPNPEKYFNVICEKKKEEPFSNIPVISDKPNITQPAQLPDAPMNENGNGQKKRPNDDIKDSSSSDSASDDSGADSNPKKTKGNAGLSKFAKSLPTAPPKSVPTSEKKAAPKPKQNANNQK
jgi:hypothetical protein